MTAPETPPAPPAPAPRPGFARRHWGKLTILAVVLIPLTGMAIWTAGAFAYTYSEGTRTGIVQKLSQRGWLCKTWEGELAMTTFPGVAPQIFHFTVRDDSLAKAIELVEGTQVTLSYKEHRGVPSTCFGDTPYFVEGLRTLGK